MYLVVGHFRFKEEGHTRAIELMNNMVAIGRQESGVNQYTFYPDPDSPCSHFLFEQWDAKELHDKHFESDEMQALVPEFFDLLALAPDVSYFDATLSSKL